VKLVWFADYIARASDRPDAHSQICTLPGR
jgi:hypothetical protein